MVNLSKRILKKFFQKKFYVTFILFSLLFILLLLIFFFIITIIKVVIKMKEKTKHAQKITLYFSIFILIICCIFFIFWQRDNFKNNQITAELNNFITVENSKKAVELIILNNTISQDPSDIQEKAQNLENYNLNIDFKSLINKNSDTIGWIKFDNININYPIVQFSDNSYYLKHNFYKEKNNAGWIYADSSNTFPNLEKNTVIYGHNRRNGTMFSKLNNYLNLNFCENESNQTFFFSTTEKNYIAYIFSTYKINAKGFTIQTSFENEISFYDYLNKVKEQSIFDYDITISPNDKIITLCTCDNNTKNRIVIHAKLKEIIR